MNLFLNSLDHSRRAFLWIASYLFGIQLQSLLSRRTWHGYFCQRSFELISHPVPFLLLLKYWCATLKAWADRCERSWVALNTASIPEREQSYGQQPEHDIPHGPWEFVRKETVWRGERKETGVWCSVCGWTWQSTRERNNFRNYQNIWMNTVPQGPFESPSYIKVLYFHFANKISNLHLCLPMRESSTVEHCR